MPWRDPRFDARRRRWDNGPGARLRGALLGVVLLLSTAKFLAVVHGHYPIGQWMFWHHARALLLSAGWGLVCLGAGHRVLSLMWRRTLPVLEHVTLSFSLGVLLFFLAMFAGGVVGLYGPTFAVVLPMAMLGVCAPSLVRYSSRLMRHIRHARRKLRAPAPTWMFPIAIYGIIGVGMLYLLILTPENVAYDARWYHLPIAEHYAAEGAIRATPEGWFHAALPQLASLLYTWAFQLPGLEFFDRIELSAHIEFVVFLFTLAGVPVLVRTVLPRVRAHLAWTATFLFPGIFLYDSTLAVAADHIAALWAVPIFITMWRALRELEPRRCLLWR